MPFFQGAYNFELHGGIFYGERRHRRLHHANSNQPVASQTVSLTQKPAHKSKSRPLHLLHALEHTDSEASDNITDEEARTLPGSPSCRESVSVFLTDALFSQIYMQLLLHLPSHYFDRVDRLSRDANMALKEILDLAVESNMKCGDDFQTQILDLGQHSSPTIVDPDTLPPAYRQLTVRWSCFIDDLLEEWRTLNIVSALLVPGILTMFQVTGASNDPVTRYLAFWSLISALISLLYGCAFIIQFSRMRKPSIAIEWAFEAQNPHSSFWTVGVMLSLPVVWLSWSIIAFVVCIIAFMWRCDANPPPEFLVPPHTELAFRVFVSTVLGVGAFYGMLILTSFKRYGSTMDQALSGRIDLYIASAASHSTLSPPDSFTPSPTLSKSRRQDPKHGASFSSSPTYLTAGPPLSGGRSVSFEPSSSITSHHSASLSNSVLFPQAEKTISSSDAEPPMDQFHGQGS